MNATETELFRKFMQQGLTEVQARMDVGMLKEEFKDYPSVFEETEIQKEKEELK